MANTPRKPSAGNDEQQGGLPLSEQLTYLPSEGDPPSTKWHGIVFHAHVPKTVTKTELIEQAKGNRFFKVGAFDPGKDAKAVVIPAVSDPKTPEEYRAHLVDWLKRVTNINDMVHQWVKEQPMRDACEVGADDYSYIGSLFHPRMFELARAAGLNDRGLSDLWASNGVFQLPF